MKQEKKSLIALAAFVLVAAVVIVLGICVLKVPVVPLCFLMILEAGIAVMLHHADLIIREKGERQGMREARKNVAWYIKGLPDAAALRNACCTLEAYSDLQKMAEEIIKRGERNG